MWEGTELGELHKYVTIALWEVLIPNLHMGKLSLSDETLNKPDLVIQLVNCGTGAECYINLIPKPALYQYVQLLP